MSATEGKTLYSFARSLSHVWIVTNPLLLFSGEWLSLLHHRHYFPGTHFPPQRCFLKSSQQLHLYIAVMRSSFFGLVSRYLCAAEAHHQPVRDSERKHP